MPYRHDKNITKEIPSFRKLLNVITPGRNQAVVYFEQAIDVTKTLSWIEKYNAQALHKTTFLHLFVHFAGRCLHENPRINRYVSGYKFYQRSDVTISVSAKKKKQNGSKIVLLKVPIKEDDTLESVSDRFHGMLKEGRTKENTSQEKEMNLFAYLPGFVLKLALSLIQWLDRRHWLPGFFVNPDPMFSSLVVANLGSVGMEAGYHHLYEYGNCPFFAMIGRQYSKPVYIDGQLVERQFINIKYTFDERIEDGLACGYALDALKKLLEDPNLFDANQTYTDHNKEKVVA
ncbi:MAG: 2-oxo acid dehydrogenase subunit E2 [bacterium]|nr:2-oxo acid dehydrogenase subunit E2 [bacterium]MBU1917458.1 2-oxo acid dehydrogenase subunit E2 [bacterium]